MLIKRINNKIRHFIQLHQFINLAWLLKLNIKLKFTHKIKVGFGPITSGEKDLAERKWRIDPIVNLLNSTSKQFAAGVFIHPEQMKNFDLIIIVKKFNPLFIEEIQALKKKGKLFIYDLVDNPNCGLPFQYYYREYPDFLNCMNGYIYSSPLHATLLNENKPSTLIEHPIIHHIVKNTYSHFEPIRLLAHGYHENLNNLKDIESMLPALSHQINRKIILVYHCETVLNNTEHVEYIRWTLENSFEIMKSCDIAISIKKLHVLHQKTKPSTKLISFMAAGIPVICTPTVADRLVMTHGINGYFAYTQDDWKNYIIKLASNPNHCKQIGKAARNTVIKKYSIPAMTERYIQLFNEVIRL